MKTAAIMISRQPLRVSSESTWLKAASEAVLWAGENGYTLLTSVGVKTWEMVLFLGNRYGVNCRIFLIADNEDDFRERSQWVRGQFRLDDKAEFVYLPGQGKDKSEICGERDRIIANEADLLIPVSIRKGGNMDSLLEEMQSRGKAVERCFEIRYQKREEKLKYDLKGVFSGSAFGIGKEYLYHWTRASEGPWPGQLFCDYYESVFTSRSFPGSAFATLKNILFQRKIFASSRHMPSGVAVVSFTGASPAEFAPLMRWRSRYREMSFEPYGIGIEKQAALQCGFARVKYFDKPGKTPCDERWIHHSAGKTGSWIIEDEYRHCGDFDLQGISPDKLICLCYSETEALEIESEFKIRSFYFL